MTTISATTLVRRRGDLLGSDLTNTETVILDVTGGSYYGMKNVGKAIWDHLKTPVTVHALCERLVEQFDVDAETCRRETTAFLEKLHEKGLIVATD